MNEELRLAIIKHAERIGANPVDLANVISYETGGTFDPWQKGPTTQWGQHVGFIQMGEPQRQQYGYTPDKSIDQLVGASADYLVGEGYKPGMSLLDMYSIINAGAPGKYSATDAHNGGAPGTVAAKVNEMMGAHRQKAAALLGGAYSTAITASAPPMVEPARPSINGPESISSNVNRSPVDTSMVFENQPLKPYTTREQYVRETMEVVNSNEVSLMDGIGAAIDNNWSIAWAMKENPQSGIDPNFRGQVKAEAFKEMSQGIPEDYLEGMIRSQSVDEMREQRQIALQQLENDRILGELGWTGTGLNILAAILDPVAIGAAVASEGVMAPVIAGAKLGRLGRIGASMFMGGTSNLAAEAAVGVFSPRVDGQSMAEAFGVGMILGGAFGALAKNPTLSEEAAAMVRQGQGLSSVGAAAVPNRMEPVTIGNLVDDIMPGDVARSFMDWARPDVVARLSASGDDGTRLLGRYLAQEATGLSGDEVVEVAATVRKRMLQHSTVHQLEADVSPSYSSWLSKKNKWHSEEAWIEFNDLVSEYRDTLDPALKSRYDREIVEANAAYDRFYDRFAKLAQNPGVERGEDLRGIPGFSQPRENYRPMMADSGEIHRIRQMIGEDGMVSVVRKAIQEATEDLDIELINKMARGYVQRLERIGYGSNIGFDDVFTRGDRDEIYAFLKDGIEDGGLGLDDADASKIYEKMVQMGKKKENAKSPTSRGLRRTAIDYNVSEKFMVNGQEVTVSVKDFFMKDAHAIAKRYADEMSGHIALAQMVVKHPKTGKVLINGIVNKSEWQKVMEQIKERFVLNGLSPKESQAALERLQYLYDHLTGKPRLGDKAGRSWAQWTRRAAQLQFMRIMQNMGITQAQELANIPAQIGLKAAFQSMPSFRRILDKNRKPVPVTRKVKKTRVKQEPWTEKTITQKPEEWTEITEDLNGNQVVRKFTKMVDVEETKTVMRDMKPERWKEVTINEDGTETVRYVNRPPPMEEYEEEITDYDPGLGPYKDQVLQELMSATGEGYDDYLHRFKYRAIDDNLGEVFGQGKLDKAGATFDKLAPKGQRLISNISLMRHVNAIAHQWTMRAIAQKMANLAFKHAEKLKTNKFKLEDINGFLTGRDADRFKLLGLDTEKTKLIFNQMLKHADGAAKGERLTSLNLNAWDPKARAYFVEALYQWTGRTIQTNDVGNLAMWMTNPVANLVFQFRTFVFGAYAKQTLYGIRHADGRTMANLMVQLIAGAGVWYLLSKARSVGEADPEQYMEDRASWADLGKAAVSRAGISSVLPMFYDQTMPVLAPPLAKMTGTNQSDWRLDYRTSGTPTSGFVSVPTLNHIDDLSLGIGGIADALVDGRNLSQAEYKRLLRATLGNHLVTTTGLSYLVQDLPKQAPKER